MRLQKIFLLICLLVIRSLFAMEERPSSKPESLLTYEEEYEEASQGSVLLELMDGDKIIYTIEIPQLFAQRSSVIRNNLAFQEEEEGTIPKVQFDSSTVTIEQFIALEMYIAENEKQRNVKKTLGVLLEQWYPDNLIMFFNLLTFSNFIGNEHLYKACLQKLSEILRRALEKRKLDVFFEMPDVIAAFDVQEDLKNTIAESPALIALAQQFSREKKIGRQNLYSLGSWNDKEWLVLKVSTERKKGSITESVHLMTLPNNTTVAKFIVPFNKEQIVNPFFFSPSQKILYATGGQSVDLFNVETGDLITHIEAPLPVLSISFDHNNTLLAVVMYKKIIIYDLATQEAKKEFDIELGSRTALSPDGARVAFQKKGGEIEIWDLVNGKLITSIALKANESVWSLEFLNDSHSLVIASSSGEVEIFNIITQQGESFTRKGNFTNVTVATTSDDRLLSTFFEGKVVAAVSGRMIPAQGIIVVDLQSKTQIKRIKVKPKVKSLKFSSDGYKLVFGDSSGLYQVDLFPKKIKRLSLQELLLFWYLLEQIKNNQPLKIPERYNDVFEQFPKKIKKYLGTGQPGVISEEPQKEVTSRKEKRKEPEEKEKGKEKKKSTHKRFKWD